MSVIDQHPMLRDIAQEEAKLTALTAERDAVRAAYQAVKSDPAEAKLASEAMAANQRYRGIWLPHLGRPETWLRGMVAPLSRKVNEQQERVETARRRYLTCHEMPNPNTYSAESLRYLRHAVGPSWRSYMGTRAGVDASLQGALSTLASVQQALVDLGYYAADVGLDPDRPLLRKIAGLTEEARRTLAEADELAGRLPLFRLPSEDSL